MRLGFRFLGLVLALAVAPSLLSAAAVAPGLLVDLAGPTVMAWLRSLSPLQIELLRDLCLTAPGTGMALAVSLGAAVAAHRRARTVPPPDDTRWVPRSVR
jgi:hypothetical protein